MYGFLLIFETKMQRICCSLYLQSVCCYVDAFANSFVSFEIAASVGCHEAMKGTAGSVTLATASSVIKPK
jgi:hypothetical protein